MPTSIIIDRPHPELLFNIIRIILVVFTAAASMAMQKYTSMSCAMLARDRPIDPSCMHRAHAVGGNWREVAAGPAVDIALDI